MTGPLTPERRDELRAMCTDWKIEDGHIRNALDEALTAHDALARDLDVAREALREIDANKDGYSCTPCDTKGRLARAALARLGDK